MTQALAPSLKQDVAGFEVADLTQLPTPTLALDGPAIRRNIERLANYSSDVGIKIRPHTKTHKSRFLAALQLDAGACGITCAKVSEAERMSEPGQDVLLAYPPVGALRAERLAALARDRTVRAAVDTVAAVTAASEAARAANVTMGLLVDLDVGMGRTGVESPAAALALAQAIDRAPGLRLDGIMIYPGHIWEPADQQATALKAVSDLVAKTLELWVQHGLAAAIVSGGSTPTAYQSHLIGNLTEIRPGTYIFNDMNTVDGGFCKLEDCAARILATVISDAVSGQVVIDAGSKTLTNDRNISAPDNGFGHIVEYPHTRIRRLSEEHGQVDITACDRKPKVGERVTVIPNHICPCVNLRDTVWWSEPNEPLRELPVDARGLIQ
jgi:D-serine deaminase-like pyridoxal phosphate-dependent protein